MLQRLHELKVELKLSNYRTIKIYVEEDKVFDSLGDMKEYIRREAMEIYGSECEVEVLSII